jgi:hypothetical protein
MTLLRTLSAGFAMNYLLGGPCATWAQTKAASPLLGAKYTWLVGPGIRRRSGLYRGASVAVSGDLAARIVRRRPKPVPARLERLEAFGRILQRDARFAKEYPCWWSMAPQTLLAGSSRDLGHAGDERPICLSLQRS